MHSTYGPLKKLNPNAMLELFGIRRVTGWSYGRIPWSLSLETGVEYSSATKLVWYESGAAGGENVITKRVGSARRAIGVHLLLVVDTIGRFR